MAAAAVCMLVYGAVAVAGPSATELCRRDFATDAQRRAAVAKVEAAGGLVYLLARDAAAPFECAAFYLAHGLNVNAVGPNGLTTLHYAIKVNRPQMLRFVIAHGADLHRKASDKRLEPMAYAYYLALNNPQIDRTRVLAILNQALIAHGQ